MKSINSNFTKDAILLIRARAGCKDSFNVLYERYWDQAYSNAFKRLKNEDQSKDIVQDIFINIWLNKDTNIENLPAYLNVAVRNRVFKLAEREKHFSPFLDNMSAIPAIHQEADTNIQYQEFYAAYEALINSLPPKRQMIFRLRFNEDLSTKEIADEMGITRKTVQNQLGKAIEHLRIVLLPCFILLLWWN